ncbi:unnamed protein product [Gemmata massiliana]|uniref:Uncharacterized protein n=1 Tax=Gemmata massiliana TaxID=1210884 RepID=A0A6P2D1J9_9BACT|nr:unnamed protein product [Gemmata massiliana]
MALPHDPRPGRTRPRHHRAHSRHPVTGFLYSRPPLVRGRLHAWRGCSSAQFWPAVGERSPVGCGPLDGATNTARATRPWRLLGSEPSGRSEEWMGDRDVRPVREGNREEAQDVRGDVASGRWHDPRGASGRAHGVGRILLHRPGCDRGRHPRMRDRPLLVGDVLPRPQRDRRRRTAASTVGARQCRVVPHPLVGPSR